MHRTFLRARRTTLLWALGLAMAAPTLFGLATPATSSANSTTGTFLTVADKSSGVFLTSILPSPFSVGDCVAIRGSAIRLQRFSNSSAFVTWGQTSFTRQTHSGDVWHGTFYFLDATGRRVATVGPLDGDTMWPGRYYTWLRTSPDFFMSAATYDSITQVQWKGEC
jgi:hypothetical protein